MDFRGLNDSFFVLLSVPRLDFAMKTRDATFIMPGYSPKLVHGSFFTDAMWRVKTKRGRHLFITASARDAGFDVFDDKGLYLANFRTPWKEYRRDDVRVFNKQVTVFLRGAGWETNVTRKPVYNLISGADWRFDITIRTLNGTGFEKVHGSPSKDVWPHGIMGQTWDGDASAVDGKMDDYENQGSEVWTTSMAEGGIEGVASDYIVTEKNFDFLYSRFYATEAPPRNVSLLRGSRRVGSNDSTTSSSSSELYAV